MFIHVYTYVLCIHLYYLYLCVLQKENATLWGNQEKKIVGNTVPVDTKITMYWARTHRIFVFGNAFFNLSPVCSVPIWFFL